MRGLLRGGVMKIVFKRAPDIEATARGTIPRLLGPLEWPRRGSAGGGAPRRQARHRAARLVFRVNCQKVPDWYSARRVGETVYGYKTLTEESSGRILGAI